MPSNSFRVRFSDEPDEPKSARRREKDAIRAKRYRERRKSYTEVDCTSNPPRQHYTSPPLASITASPPITHLEVDNQSPGDINASAINNRDSEERSQTDEGFIGIEDHEEQAIYHESEERSTNTQSDDGEWNIPQFLPEDNQESADESTTSALSDLDQVTAKLLDQLQGGFHGCSAEEHSEVDDTEPPQHENRYCTLSNLFPEGLPSTLSSTRMISRDDAKQFLSDHPALLQDTFCGFSPGPSVQPRYLSLSQGSRPSADYEDTYDIDSLLCFAESLAAASRGIYFYCAPQYTQNIRTDVHLVMPKSAGHDEPRLMAAQLKDVPHFQFGRLSGANEIVIHIFFPYLQCEDKFLALTTLQFTRWFDQVFYPVLNRIMSTDYIQHIPASYQHAVAQCRAPQIENRLSETASYQAQLKLSYFLPPDALGKIWDEISKEVLKPGLQDFRDPQLYFSARGIKLQFKNRRRPSDLLSCMENFDTYLRQIIDLSYIDKTRSYVDLARERCPTQSLTRARNGSQEDSVPQVYLFRRCCLQSYLYWLYDGQIPKTGHNIYYNTMLRDACDMTTLTPLKSSLRQGGLLYSQFYSLTKEILDAAKTYPFQNTALEDLAVDPQIIKATQKIVQGNARGLRVTRQAYQTSKHRCNIALRDSRDKNFGVREEHRISWTLFQSIIRRLSFTRATLSDSTLNQPANHIWAISTSSFLDHTWRNINKFSTAFEICHALTDPTYITKEQTKVMAMFLRCLRFSIGSYDYSRHGALWWSRRDLRGGPSSSDRTVYGLGFQATLQKYGYCWIEPKIDWNELVFQSDVRENILFGVPTMQREVLKRYLHLYSFFNNCDHVDTALSLLTTHHKNISISKQLLHWLIHIILKQFRIDVLAPIHRELIPEQIPMALQGDIGFSYAQLRQVFKNPELHLVAGNHTEYKEPGLLMNFLFGYHDHLIRNHWSHKPFRILHQRARAAIGKLASQRLLGQFDQLFRRSFLLYHWIIPYPSSDGLSQTTKKGLRMWYSVDTNIISEGLDINPSLRSWVWAKKKWRRGQTPAYPIYINWNQDGWKSWISHQLRSNQHTTLSSNDDSDGEERDQADDIEKVSGYLFHGRTHLARTAKRKRFVKEVQTDCSSMDTESEG